MIQNCAYLLLQVNKVLKNYFMMVLLLNRAFLFKQVLRKLLKVTICPLFRCKPFTIFFFFTEQLN